MCDGSLRPIAEMRDGDWVLSRHEVTGEQLCRQVELPFANPDKPLIALELEALSGGFSAGRPDRCEKS